MAKKSIHELDLKAQPTGEIDYENIPDEFSAAPPPPYPGVYGFKLPNPDRMGMLFDTFEAGEGDEKRQYVNVIFDNDDPLVITQGKEKVGEPFTTRISNKPRNRAKKGEPEVLVSDGVYFLRALDSSVKVKNFDNKGFIDAVSKQGGKSFVADLEWSTYCNTEKQIYVEVEGQGLQPGLKDDQGTPQNGCGERYYQGSWPRDTEGKYKARLDCKCGASLRPFANLRNFKAAK